MERKIQSIDRAIDVLELFLNTNHDLSVKEMSEELQLSKSTIHGIIKTLEIRGYLQQNATDSKYGLGLKLFELGTKVGSNFNIRDISRPVMKEVGGEFKETVHLVLFERGEAIYVEKLDGPHALRIYSHVGKKAPLYCTGVGKAILAYQKDKEIDRLLAQHEMIPFTQFTLTETKKIKQQLLVIREQGYSIDDEEIELGLKCVAAPIFNYNGEVTAAISLAAPKIRLGEEKTKEVIVRIKRAAIDISTSLGYKF